MEDNTRFTPTYTGVPHARLPFRSVYIPVVPCALDGCLSLLELIAKMQYVVNSYQAGIEANHTDIVNLAAELDQAVTELHTYVDTQDAATLAAAKTYADGLDAALRTYVDTQDAATLASANAYAESLRDLLTTYVDTQDAATLAAAKTYADGLDAALRAYVDTQDAATLASANAYAESLRDLLTTYVDTQDAATLAAAKTYADGLDAALRTYVDTQDAATLAAAKTYADGLVSTLRAYVDAQLALKQDALTFDLAPTLRSQNPVTSGGVYDAIAAVNSALSAKILAINYDVHLTGNDVNNLALPNNVSYNDIRDHYDNGVNIRIYADNLGIYFSICAFGPNSLHFSGYDPNNGEIQIIEIADDNSISNVGTIN